MPKTPETKPMMPGYYPVNGNVQAEHALLRWHGYTVFLSGRVVGIVITETDGRVSICMLVGVSWCSPAEKRISYDVGWDTAARRMIEGDLAHPPVPVVLRPGRTLEKVFRQALGKMSAVDLARYHIPDRLIERLCGRPPWTLHTVVQPAGSVIVRTYKRHERQDPGASKSRRAP